MTQLRPDVMLRSTRVGEGSWDYVSTGDEGDRVGRFCTLSCEIEEWDGATVDDSFCFMLLAQPGDLMTRYERDACLHDLGFVARLSPFYHSAHEYTESERAQLSTLADLTSLAVSGCPSSSRT